jgi:hypothetical protein
MFLKKMIMSARVIVIAFTISILGLAGSTAIAQECPDDDEFTTDFLLEDCKFIPTGINPYFILKPCYKLVLESDEERAEITVLPDTKKIRLDDRVIVTRVVEERAYELEEGDGGEVEETLIEISRNFFAICKQTNAVHYFGEDSADCEDGFADNEEECEDGSDPITVGSWLAGENGAMPGLIMPGTFLLGSKYFQEQASNDDAVDRGENVEMGLDAEDPEGGPDFTGCVRVVDTNPSEGVCDVEDGDSKVYCPEVGMVMDEDMMLVDYGGFGKCNRHDHDDDDDHK